MSSLLCLYTYKEKVKTISHNLNETIPNLQRKDKLFVTYLVTLPAAQDFVSLNE
jgi:hypothetical protein